MLKVHEIFESLQGEGSHMGKQMTFVRLYGCSRVPMCPYCDQPQENFVEMTEEEIIAKCTQRIVCLTGGEPLSQDIYPLCSDLAQNGHQIHIETNGEFDTYRKGYDTKGGRIFELLTYNHLSCCPHFSNPKDPRFKLRESRIDDLKILVTEETHISDCLTWEEAFSKSIVQFWIQPVNSLVNIHQGNLAHAIELLKGLPNWGLSPQLHKLLGVK